MRPESPTKPVTRYFQQYMVNFANNGFITKHSDKILRHCWHSGYMNGTIGFSAFNVTENEECKDKGNQYQAGFDAASKK